MSTLPPYVTRDLISERLPIIFPEGTPNRNYCIRDIAASTIFTMIYVGAVEGNEIYISPMHVYRMTGEYAKRSDDESRMAYSGFLRKGKGTPRLPGTPWYADTTRESIRDETLREGLGMVNAALSLKKIDTTSSRPRHYLQKEFTELFNPELTGEALKEAIAEWQRNSLSKGALTRVRLASQQLNSEDGKVLITFPNGETRKVSAGVSSQISKAVIEVFTRSFLHSPVVLWLSTSADKVVKSDDELARSIGLNVEAGKNLPDIVLVDTNPDQILVVFVEVVASDGPVNERKKKALLELTDTGNFDRSQVAFVTAFMDRDSNVFRKTISHLAWDTFAWCVSEPDKLVVLREGSIKLSALVK